MKCLCAVECDYNDEGSSSHYSKMRVAVNEHRCTECRRSIKPGEEYEYVFGVWDSGQDSFKTCIDCKSVRDTFFDLFAYTQIWDYCQDEFGNDYEIPESCISELTPGARERVCDLIEDGWDVD